ncbi:MAG: ubiquinol-cytochrome C reductase, partial [Nocardioides sp.]
MSIDHHEPTPEVEPIADPGMPEHTWRPTDVDPRAEKRAERQVAGFFLTSMLFTIAFVVAYVTIKIGDNHDTFLYFGASTVALGATLGGAMLCIGIGIILWARKLMGDHEITEQRHRVDSSPEDRASALAAIDQGIAESGITRRPLIRNTLLGALGFAGIAPIVMLRDLGPLPGKVLHHTLWKPGMRVVRDVVGTPIKPEELEIGDLVNAQPAALFELDEHGEPVIHGVDKQIGKSKSSLIVVRMEPDDIIAAKGRENWSVNGIIAYSKICTH